MSGTEWLVVLIAAAGGYWLVSFFMKGSQARKAEPGPVPEPAAAPAKPVPPPWWEVLGISPQASVEEIRAAYRSQIAPYQPDKLATLGPEMREVAHRKSQQISEAYQQAVQAQ